MRSRAKTWSTWHEQHVHPNNIILGMIGDFDSKQMEQKLRAAFESWGKVPSLRRSTRNSRPPLREFISSRKTT